MRSISVLCALSLLTFAACGGGEPEPKAPETTVAKTEPTTTAAPTTSATVPAPETKKEEPPPPPPKKKPSEIITGGTTFMFSLADSPDAKKAADEKCAKIKDEKKKEACGKDVETAAAGEGIRFEKDDKGDWWWVSFGKEKDKEVIYSKVKFKIASETADKITLTPEGKDTGKKPMKTLPKEMVLDVPDESTVAMSDPGKGKLVFKKK